MSVLPAIACRTLGVAERMRLPSPAARTMTIGPCDVTAHGPPGEGSPRGAADVGTLPPKHALPARESNPHSEIQSLLSCH